VLRCDPLLLPSSCLTCLRLADVMPRRGQTKTSRSTDSDGRCRIRIKAEKAFRRAAVDQGGKCSSVRWWRVSVMTPVSRTANALCCCAEMGQHEALRYFLDKLTQHIVYECELAGFHLATELIRRNPSARNRSTSSWTIKRPSKPLLVSHYARASTEHKLYSKPSASHRDLDGGPQKSAYTG